MEASSVLIQLVLVSCCSHGVSGSVFLSGPAANVLLQRHKRYNSGFFEEVSEGDLERECVEEVCDLEEAREVFEDDQQTMEFWARYSDGDQCKSSPCLNGGSCTDHVGFYTCSCESGFIGRNCDIIVTKRCDVNNGDCTHFCEPMATFGAKCSCARGYTLNKDGVTCEPEGDFPCGRTALVEVSPGRSRSLHFEGNQTQSHNFTATPSSPTNESTRDTFLRKLSTWVKGVGKGPTEESPVKPFRRIVGGEVVTPGEIPWQAALVEHPGGRLFCGATILGEQWVITAAHCLEEVHSFLVRVGEHDVLTREETQQDHEVMQKYIHPLYNTSVSSHNHDIALLYLAAPIVFSATVRPICLGPKAFVERLVRVASPATVSGWGRTRFLGFTSRNLQKVEVPFTDRAECKRSSSSRVTRFMFCAGYYNQERDACQGDSGGPHTNSVHNTWFLTGIVSWGEECAREGKYGVYTRVSLYYRWIKYIMGVTRHRVVLVEDEEED